MSVRRLLVGAAAVAGLTALAACTWALPFSPLGWLVSAALAGALLLGGVLTGCLENNRRTREAGGPGGGAGEDTGVGGCLSAPFDASGGGDVQVGPCLAPHPADGGLDAHTGPCLSPSYDAGRDAYVGPCLSPSYDAGRDAYVGPCLSPSYDAGRDVYVGPCLDVAPDVGPCLSIAPDAGRDAGAGPCLSPPFDAGAGPCLAPPQDAGQDVHVGPCLSPPLPRDAGADARPPAREEGVRMAAADVEKARRSAVARLEADGTLPQDVARRLGA